MISKPLVFTYRNHRGEISDRRVMPAKIMYGSTPWHPEPQWFLTALDLDKNVTRHFAMRDIGVPLDTESQRIQDLIEANNRYLDRARAAEARQAADAKRVTALDALLTARILRSVAVENELLAVASGKRGPIHAEEAQRMALKLGVPAELNGKGTATPPAASAPIDPAAHAALVAERDALRVALVEAHFSICYRYQHDIAEDPPMIDGVAQWRVWHLRPDARTHMTAADQRLFDKLLDTGAALAATEGG